MGQVILENVAAEINRSGTHKIILISCIDPDKTGKPFFVELSYTGGKNTFSGGTFSFAMTKVFNTSW